MTVLVRLIYSQPLSYNQICKSLKMFDALLYNKFEKSYQTLKIVHLVSVFYMIK